MKSPQEKPEHNTTVEILIKGMYDELNDEWIHEGVLVDPIGWQLADKNEYYYNVVDPMHTKTKEQSELADLRTKLAAAEERNRKLEAVVEAYKAKIDASNNFTAHLSNCRINGECPMCRERNEAYIKHIAAFDNALAALGGDE